MLRVRRRGVGALAGLLGLALLGGASPAQGASDLEEIRETQKKILERLEAQDKILKDIQSRIQAAPRAAAQPDPDKVHEIPVAHSPVKGGKNARVTLVEFSDFQWPFCAQSTSLVDQLLKDYPKDLQFVYKHLPLTQIHPQAMPAAKASMAAAKQGKFWEMHDELFRNYRQLGDENIRKMAEGIGLDMKKFDRDMKSAEIEKQVQKDMALAQDVGVRGTPTFFLNGRRVMNRSPEALRAMIDAELKKK